MLYTSLYSLFKAQQIILYEISSIATVNNELCGRQGKGRIKRGCINFDTPSSICLTHDFGSSFKAIRKVSTHLTEEPKIAFTVFAEPTLIILLLTLFNGEMRTAIKAVFFVIEKFFIQSYSK